MKIFSKIIAVVIALFTVFALVSCDGETKENSAKKSDKNKVTTVEPSNSIKAAMENNNRLSWSNYFLAEDGSIIARDSDSDRKEAGVYAKLGNVKKIIKGAGISSFALTESGDLYHGENKIGEGITAVAYCTTNMNVEGFCIINNELRRLNSYKQLDNTDLSYMFKNYPSGDKFSGKAVFIEADKHDFIVLNDKGKFFAYWTSEEYGKLDYTGFEDLAVVDIAKHMGDGFVESLTVAGIKGDGTVVATGTYADDILSWGKLCDIAMSDGMIVGLTEDGKVKMTGDYAENMREAIESWTNIVAIEAGYTNGGNIDYIVTALDSNGVFHYASLINDRYSADVGSASLDSVNDDSTWHKYTPDGKEYYSNYDGEWEENEY